MGSPGGEWEGGHTATHTVTQTCTHTDPVFNICEFVHRAFSALIEIFLEKYCTKIIFLITEKFCAHPSPSSETQLQTVLFSDTHTQRLIHTDTVKTAAHRDIDTRTQSYT